MFKQKKWLALALFLPFLLFFLKLGTAGIQSLADYIMNKSVVDQGGAPSQSSKYKLIDTIGQPGGIGAASSSNYQETSGFLSGRGELQTNPVPIFISANHTQDIGSEFWVDVIVGNDEYTVSDLFGLGFDITFTSANYMDVVTPHSNNVLSGDFIGSDVVLIQNVDEIEGKVSIGVSRKAGQGGVNGTGVVARIKFISDISTPDGTLIVFRFSDVTANDPSGNIINMNPVNLVITLNTGLVVWPGDTNNDGIVNQVDVLPLGLFWASTGPARSDASMTWIGQPASPWTPENSTYADANGD